MCCYGCESHYLASSLCASGIFFIFFVRSFDCFGLNTCFKMLRSCTLLSVQGLPFIIFHAL